MAAALDTSAEELLGGEVDLPPGRGRAGAHPVLEELDAAECLRLISPGGVGRVGFTTALGPAIIPVNYVFHEGAALFRTAIGGPMDEDLRTHLKGVAIKIAFEVDHIDEATRTGWSVLILGGAHQVSAEDRAAAVSSGVEAWAGGERELYIRIVPAEITGRRIRQEPGAPATT
ncbi:pyridoxamine 5'-phosphate oxidase family protein [Planobispora takensis]|uniref:Pyridoxamine 5'-phosphate oxidase family protein n=1 Tax=Planobispora takensis TaxID=1367882 RepID=A0A8J3T885_9ACTN|nr:pyridoxamine 5'-phosphate oxidase family protein [Planobispora takensis]GII06120.1 hypothetical protein Pta02_81280 [Planobispora takensis]